MGKRQDGIEYHNYDELPLMLCAKEIAALLRISTATVYCIFSAIDFPTITIGSRKLVKKEKLFAWLEKHENDIPYLTNANVAERRREIMKKDSESKGEQKTYGE